MSDAQSDEDTLIGQTVAQRFRLVGVVARGAVGRVYKGVQEPLGRFVAIKVLEPVRGASAAPESAHVRRFIREATVASRLQHPNTVVVHDYGTLPDGRLFLVMEFLEGPTLRAVMAQAGGLPLYRAVHIARQIASSLADAHRNGVVHRDLKPPNVMLVQRGSDRDFVKVVDFGLVKSVYGDDDEDLTVEGFFVGSPVYMSPEQCSGGAVGVPSDVYAFGTLLYEMLAGRAPFRERGEKLDPAKVLSAQMTQAPPKLSQVCPSLEVPPELEQLIMQCLAKAPGERPPSMEAIASDLEVLERSLLAQLDGERAATGLFAIPHASPLPPPPSQPAPPPLPEYTSEEAAQASSTGSERKLASRTPLYAAIAAGVSLLLAGAWWFWQTQRERSAPDSSLARAVASAPQEPREAAQAPLAPAASPSELSQQSKTPPSPASPSPEGAKTSEAAASLAPAPAGSEAEFPPPAPAQPVAPAPVVAAAAPPAEPAAPPGAQGPPPAIPPEEAAATPAAPRGSGEPTAASGPAAMASTTSLVVESAPAGAAVYLGGRSLGRTPLEAPLPSAELAGAELRLVLDGHRASKTRLPASLGARHEVKARLVAERGVADDRGRAKPPERLAPARGGADIKLSR